MTRIIDILLSGALIVLFFPFILPIMIGLKLTGEHDIFYKQTRIGKGGKPFGVWKFATMLRNSPNMSGGLITQRKDPRILPMGNFLRKTKINELPQLMNVFGGSMSFVGPRPFVKSHFEIYSPEAQEAIKKMTPGVTGIGSIVFRNEEEILAVIGEESGDGEAGLAAANRFHDRVITPYKGKLEEWYFGHRNLYSYFKIIFLTAWSVMKPQYKAAYSFNGLPEVPEDLKRFIA